MCATVASATPLYVGHLWLPQRFLLHRRLCFKAPSHQPRKWLSNRFRKALRLHDNPSLVRALQNASHVTPIFCLDPWFVKGGRWFSTLLPSCRPPLLRAQIRPAEPKAHSNRLRPWQCGCQPHAVSSWVALGPGCWAGQAWLQTACTARQPRWRTPARFQSVGYQTPRYAAVFNSVFTHALFTPTSWTRHSNTSWVSIPLFVLLVSVLVFFHHQPSSIARSPTRGTVTLQSGWYSQNTGHY